MIHIKTLPLYIKQVQELSFASSNFEKPYNLIIYPENTLFTKVYSTLNIKRIHIRSVFVLNNKVPRVFMSAPIAKLYRSLKLVPHFSQETLLKKNVFNDLSLLLQAIEVRYKPTNYKTKFGHVLTDKIRDVCDLFKDWNNILLYIVDLNEPFPHLIFKRKIYPILDMLHKEIFPFNSLLLCTITTNANYTLLVKDKNYDFNRVLSIIRNLKGNIKVDLNTKNKIDKIDEVTDEIINKSKIKVTDKETKERLKDIIKIYFQDNPDKFQKVSKEIKPEDALVIVSAATVYISTGNKQSVNKIKLKLNNIENKERVVSNMVNKVIDDVLPKPIVTSTSTNIITQSSNINEVVDNKVPTHLFLKRQLDYEKNLTQDLTYCFEELSSKEFPLILQSVKIQESKQNKGEIDKSDFNIIIAEFKDKFGTKQTIKIRLPKINEDGTFNVYGKRKILINQIVLNPLTFPKPFESRLSTTYSTIRIHSRRTRSRNFLQCFIAAYRLPAFVLFSYLFGFDYLVKLFDLKIDIVTKKPSKDIRQAKISNGRWLILDQNSDEYQIELFESLRMLKLPTYNINYEFGSREYFHDLIIAITGNRSSTFKIQEISENILSPTVKQVLMNKQLPYELDKVFLYMCRKVVNGYVDKRNDLNVQRIRNSEIFSELVRKQILISYNVYKERILSGDKDVKFEFNTDLVLRSFLNSEIVQDIENINPIEELAVMTRVSPIGKNIGGIPDKNAIQLEARNIHESYFGNIDPLDTPEGENVGVIQNLTVDALLTTSRGIILTKERDEKERSGLLSTSVSLVPFVNSNDGCRVLFSCSQTKQALPLLNPEVPCVQTGYESLLTNVLSDHFIKKSPVNGKITKITKDYIVIDNKYKVPLEPKFLRSGQGKSSISEFRPVIKVGDKVKKNQIIAEGSCIKDGNIAVGKNLLTAIMPYKGYTFEDGIVISKSLLDNDKFTSFHSIIEEIEFSVDDIVDYIVDIGVQTKRGDYLLRRKARTISELIRSEEEEESSEGGLTEVIGDMIIKRSPGGRIIDIEVYTNEDIDKFPLLKPYYQRTKRRLGGNKVDHFTKRGNLLHNVLIRFKIEQLSKIEVGDKLANRHGNKGIISLIEDEDKMPRTPWGEPIELILNPLGIINRMNIGQLFELYSGLISKFAANFIIKNGINNQTKSLQFIQRLYSILDKSDNKKFSINLNKNLSKISKSKFSKLFNDIKTSGFVPIIVPPFQSPGKDEIQKALKFVGASPYYKLTLPEFGQKTQNPVPVGYMYELKLEMQSELKVGARSISMYDKKTMQPTAGKRKKGGQRMGELDTYTLFSYGCTTILSEMFGPLSDDIVSKNEMIQDIINTGSTKFRKSNVSPTKELLKAYITQLMITQK